MFVFSRQIILQSIVNEYEKNGEQKPSCSSSASFFDDVNLDKLKKHIVSHLSHLEMSSEQILQMIFDILFSENSDDEIQNGVCFIETIYLV